MRSEPDEFNPYAAPEAADDPRIPSNVYWIDSRRVSYAEYWRSRSDPLNFLVVAALKTLWVPLPRTYLMVAPDELDLIDRGAIPESARAETSAAEAACEAEGMEFQFAFRWPSLGMVREVIGQVFLSADRLVYVTIFYAWVRQGQFERHQTIVGVSSELTDGRLLMVGNGFPTVNPPPRHQFVSLNGRAPETIIAAHRRLLEASGADAVPFDPNDLTRVQIRREREVMAYQNQSGTLVSMPQVELDRLNATHGNHSNDGAHPLPDPKVLGRNKVYNWPSISIIKLWTPSRSWNASSSRFFPASTRGSVASLPPPRPDLSATAGSAVSAGPAASPASRSRGPWRSWTRRCRTPAGPVAPGAAARSSPTPRRDSSRFWRG